MTAPNSTPNLESEHKWLRLAIDEARLSGKDVPVGAVILLNDQVIAKAHNQREELNDPAGHAEILAMRQAAEKLGTWRMTGTSLYTTLEPCPMCAEAILQSRVSRLIFGAYDPISGAVGSAFNLFENVRSYPIPEILGGVYKEECEILIKEFFRNKRKEKSKSVKSNNINETSFPINQP